MRLLDYITEDIILLDLKAKKKSDAIREILEFLAHKKKIKEKEIEDYYKAIYEREKIGTTAIGQEIAIPHVRVDTGGNKIICALAISREGIDFDSLDGEPSRIILLILAPLNLISEHLRLMANFARIMHTKFLRDAICNSQSVEEVIRIFKEEETT